MDNFTLNNNGFYLAAQAVSCLNGRWIAEKEFYFIVGVCSVVIEPCPLYDRIHEWCNSIKNKARR